MVRRESWKENVYNQEKKQWEWHEKDASLTSPILDAVVDNELSNLLMECIEATTICPICGDPNCRLYHTGPRRSGRY